MSVVTQPFNLGNVMTQAASIQGMRGRNELL